MKRISVWLFGVLISSIFCLPAWAGTLTTNEFLYLPGLGAGGAQEKEAFEQGLVRVDARLGKEIWVGDPKYGATLQEAITAIGGNSVILRAPAGTHAVSADLTIPANITLKVERGATLAIADGKTLTIIGGLEAGLYQVFSWTGSGKVVFGSYGGKTPELYPQWWGSAGDGSTDDTVAMKAAIIAAQDHVLRIPPGRYKLNGGCNLLDGVTGQVTIIGSTKVDWGTPTIFYIKTVSGYVFDKTTAPTRDPDGIHVEGVWFDGTNTGTDTWSGATTCDGILKNSSVAAWHRVNFKNCTVQGLNKVGAAALDLTNMYYVRFEDMKIIGITAGWGVKIGGTWSTTTYFDRCTIEGCQEGIYAVNSNAALNFTNCTIQSNTTGVVAATTSMKFDTCWFEGLGYNPGGGTTGISNQQVNLSLGAPYNTAVNTLFNFVDCNAIFDNCRFFFSNPYSAVGIMRLITSQSSGLDKSGAVEFRNCWGNDYYTKNTVPWFIKNGATGSPVSAKTEYQIVLHGRGSSNDETRLFTRFDDLRQVNFGEFYLQGQPGNQYRLVQVAGKKWTFLPWAAADGTAVTSLRYPSASVNPQLAYSASRAAADMAAQGFRTGDAWIETHYGLGYPEKWTLIREQHTTTNASIVSAATEITVTDTPTASVGDILKIADASGSFSGSVLSINAGAKTIQLADENGSPATAGFNSSVAAGVFVQTYKWAAVGQQGYRSGAATPVGASSPYFVGEMYLDTAAVKWYRSTGMTNANWVALN